MAVNEDVEIENEIKFEIVERMGVLKESENGWKREFNIVSWNGGPPTVDIREWDPEHKKHSTGYFLNRKEIISLKNILGNNTIQLDSTSTPEYRDSNDISHNVVRELGVLSTSLSGWRKEANIISWNGGPEKLDIRSWDRNRDNMSKGIMLNNDELYIFDKLIKDFDINKLPDFKNVSKNKLPYKQNPLHAVILRLKTNPELRSITTKNGEAKVCFIYCDIDNSSGSGDNKKDSPVKIEAWGSLAEDLVSNYRKGDTIDILGKQIPIDEKYKDSAYGNIDKCYRILYICPDNELINKYLALQSQFIPDNLTPLRDIKKGFEITGLNLSKRF